MRVQQAYKNLEKNCASPRLDLRCSARRWRERGHDAKCNWIWQADSRRCPNGIDLEKMQDTNGDDADGFRKNAECGGGAGCDFLFSQIRRLPLRRWRSRRSRMPGILLELGSADPRSDRGGVGGGVELAPRRRDTAGCLSGEVPAGTAYRAARSGAWFAAAGLWHAGWRGCGTFLASRCGIRVGRVLRPSEVSFSGGGWSGWAAMSDVE